MSHPLIAPVRAALTRHGYRPEDHYQVWGAGPGVVRLSAPDAPEPAIRLSIVAALLAGAGLHCSLVTTPLGPICLEVTDHA